MSPSLADRREAIRLQLRDMDIFAPPGLSLAALERLLSAALNQRFQALWKELSA